MNIVEIEKVNIMECNRDVSVVQDIEGNNIVKINNIIFKGKKAIDWNDVEEYLGQYIGDVYTIAGTKEFVCVGKDFPDEYTHSKYTYFLKGANAKAKANAAQGIPELIENATGKRHTENTKSKHNKDAKFGWDRYESRFALPVFGADNAIVRYNVFQAAMILRHSEDGNKYLYDIMNIKKETSNLFQPESLTQ